MKNIYLIRAFYFLIVLMIITMMVGINNHFFYKNEEKTTLREMRLETTQLFSIIEQCDLNHPPCVSIVKAFLENSSIRGKLEVQVNNQAWLNLNLESYSDNRKAVRYEQEHNINAKNIRIHYEKLVTPPLWKSITRSMTLSVMEWHVVASTGKSSYWINLKNFLQYVAIPRSNPALCYLGLFLLLILLAKRYLKTLAQKWDKSELLINAKNIEILNLDAEKIKLKAQNQQLNDRLTQAESIVTQLEKQQAEYAQEKQALDTELKMVQLQIAQEKDLVRMHVEELHTEKNKTLAELSKKYQDSLSHELKRKTDEINLNFTNEIALIKGESESKLSHLNDNLSEIKSNRDELSGKNEKLLQDLEVANELMNSVNDDLMETKAHRDELQIDLLKLQKSVEDEKLNQNKLMPKDFKKWIAKYLLSNPIFSAKTRSVKPKHNSNNHHGGDYVKQLYDLIAKNNEVSPFVTDVKSVNNSPYKNTIVITRVNQKGVNGTSYGYMAEISCNDDRGSCAGVFLTARSEWEAIVQAKLLIIHVKQLQSHTIIDKIAA